MRQKMQPIVLLHQPLTPRQPETEIASPQQNQPRTDCRIHKGTQPPCLSS